VLKALIPVGLTARCMPVEMRLFSELLSVIKPDRLFISNSVTGGE